MLIEVEMMAVCGHLAYTAIDLSKSLSESSRT
jgi:hypothetical protein